MLGSGRESDSEGWGEEEEGKKWGEERRERKTERETERQGNRERPADTHMHARTHAQHTQINRKRASRREGVRWGRERRKEAGKPREKWEEDKGGREGEECWEGSRKAGGVKRLSQSGRGDSCEAEAWQAARRRRRRRL